MAAQREIVGMARPPGDNQYGRAEDRVFKKPDPQSPTLAEAGIDKNLAHQARTLAAMPRDDLDRVIAEGRARIAAESAKVTRRIINRTINANLMGTPAAATPVAMGRHQCIVIDPPWPMEKIEREVRPNQVGFEYPTMAEDELAAFDVPSMADRDCHLFCWTTQRFLPMALRLTECWGFRYVCTFVWHKPGGFQPVGLPQYN